MSVSNIQKKNGMWDTHTYYKTVNHCHWSCFHGEKDDADICAVECEDGRWFLVDDQGTTTTNGILDKTADIFIEPRFFESYEEALIFAIPEITKITGVATSEVRRLLTEDD